MEPFVTKLQGSGHQLVKQGDALVARTRGAGLMFVYETRDAGLAFAGFVRAEAKRWERYARTRVAEVERGARSLTKLPEIERLILVQVDGAIETLGARVHERLSSIAEPESKKLLASKPSPKRARKAGNGAARAASTRKPKVPTTKARNGGLALAGNH